MSIRLSEAVWRDLTSSFFQWEGASAVRELVRKSREKREKSKRKEWTEDEMLVFSTSFLPLAPSSQLSLKAK